MEQERPARNSDHYARVRRARAEQDGAQGTISGEANSSATREAQTASNARATRSGADNDNLHIVNDNSGPLDQIRAFRMRLGREDLVMISVPAWDSAVMNKLSRLQQKIVRLLMLGNTHKEVANELEIQPQTVANSTHAMYKREDGLADTIEQLVSKLCGNSAENDPR